MEGKKSRREFLIQSSQAAAGIVAAGALASCASTSPVPAAKRRIIGANDRINMAVVQCREEIVPEAIQELLTVAKEIGRHPLWVYWKLSERRRTVNVSLLHEIARQKGYKPGWAHYQYQKIRSRLVA